MLPSKLYSRCSLNRGSHSNALLTWMTAAVDLLVQAFNQLIQPHNFLQCGVRCCMCWCAESFRSVLFSTVDSPPLLFSWLAAFYRMLSVLTSKLRARLNNWRIAVHRSPSQPAAQHCESWKLWQRWYRIQSPFTKSLPGCYWQLNHHWRERRHPSSSVLHSEWAL